MMRLLLACTLILIFVSSLQATPIRTAEYGAVPQREHNPRQDEHHLVYYNICSGWTPWWSGYCYGIFWDVPYAPQFGTCFDLADYPGDRIILDDVWWAWKWLGRYTIIDLEIYCADDNACPVGQPLGGYYEVWLGYGRPWAHFPFGELELSACREAGAGKFIVMLSMVSGCPREIMPYSDLNHRNVQAGCETEWRCSGHSFVYRNLESYCDVYGAPGPLWASGPDYGCTNYPLIPPGCHDYCYTTGFFCEWLIDCYVSCSGPTATERESWSEVKKLYK